MRIIRHATKEDYESVESIMSQVQQMHVDWRPDLYKMGDVVLPYERYIELIEQCVIRNE